MSTDKEAIEDIQKQLQYSNCYDGKIDGIFSDKTEIGVGLFQKHYKQYEYTQEHTYKVPLAVDYIVGEETLKAIDEARVNKWKYERPQDEIVFDVTNGSLILLMGESLDAFLEEEKCINDTLASINQINQRVGKDECAVISQDEIDKAKEKTVQELNKIGIKKISTASLTEVRRLNGKKFTYVRSDKIASHWRSYSLDVDDRKRKEEGTAKISRMSSLMTDGKFDTKKIQDTFNSKIKDTKVKLFNYDLLKDNENVEQFSKWANTLTDSVSTSAISDDKRWESSAEAQWLRFTAGASLRSTPKLSDILKGKFALDFHSNAEFALFKGECKGAMYIPNKDGFQDVVAYDIPLGDFRFNIETKLQKFAGVNAMLGANVGFELDKNTGQLNLGQGRIDAPVTVKRESTEAKAQVDLFAGVKATCGVEGEIEWRNPEKQLKFSALAGIKYAGSAAIGAGFEGEFKISYVRGKFIVRAKAGIVCGVGLSGEVGFIVDTSTIANLVQFVYHSLMNKNYSFMKIIDPKAFENLLILTIETFEKGMDKIKEVYTNIDKTVLRYWDRNFSTLEKEKNIAMGIVNSSKEQEEILKNLTPEGKGKLLKVLSKTSFKSMEEEQEKAIMKILKYCQSRKEAKQVFKSITSDNSKIGEAEGKNILLAILDDLGTYKGRTEFNNWYRELPIIPLRKGAAVVSMTSSSYFIPSINNNNTAYV